MPLAVRVWQEGSRHAKGRRNHPVVQSLACCPSKASVEAQGHPPSKSREKKPPWLAFVRTRSLGRGPGDIAGGSVSEGAKAGAAPCSSAQYSVRKEAGTRTFEGRCFLSETSQNSKGTDTTTTRPLALHVSSDDSDVHTAASVWGCGPSSQRPSVRGPPRPGTAGQQKEPTCQRCEEPAVFRSHDKCSKVAVQKRDTSF